MEQGIEMLYRLYAKELYGFIFSICKDKYLTEDILQNTFVQAIKSIENFKGNSSVKTWLFSIAKHQCFNHLKKAKICMCIEDMNLTSDCNVSEQCILRLSSDEMINGISELDEPGRSIMTLRIFGEYSFKEISRFIGKSENYCRVTFYRIKNKLRKEFKEYE